MDTRTLMQIINKLFVYSFLSFTVLFKCYAGDINIRPSVQSNFYSVDIDTQGSRNTANSEMVGSENVLQVKPSALVSYQSKKLNVKAEATAEKVHHSRFDQQNSSFTTYGLNGRYDVIDNFLQVSASTKKAYQVADSGLGVNSDTIVGSNGLTAVNSNAFSANLSANNPNLFSVKANVAIQQSKASDGVGEITEASNFSNRYNTKSKSASVKIASPLSSNTYWDIDMQATNSDRAELSQYTNSSFQASAAIPIFWDNFALATSAIIQKNKIDGDQALSNGLAYRSTSLGVRWYFVKDSYLSFSSIRSKTGDAEAKNFLGGEFYWVVSPRTNMTFKLDRNQFGEKYAASFVQASRFVRTSFRFDQGVDISSRRRFISSEVGALICPEESLVSPETFDFEDCSLPVDPSYEAQEGEVRVPIIGRDIELNDEVMRYKTGGFSIAYDNRRKFKASIGLKYGHQVSLESVRENSDRETKGVNFSAAYSISHLTDLVFNASKNETKYLTDDESTVPRQDNSDSIELKLASKRNARLTVEASISQRNRDSQRYNVQSSDNRINLGLTYVFE